MIAWLACGGEADVYDGDGGVGDDDIETRTPLRTDRMWQANVKADYGLPYRTTVEWKVKPGSDNCVSLTNGWTDVVDDSNPTHQAFISHTAEATCSGFMADTKCKGGSDTVLDGVGKVATPEVQIGPIDKPEPPPVTDPDMTCKASVTFAVGERWDEKNASLCEITGVPRQFMPTVVLIFGSSLPPGITAGLCLTANYSTIVFQGRVNAPWHGKIRVAASRGSWADLEEIEVTVK